MHATFVLGAAEEAIVSHWTRVLGTELLVGPLEEQYCNGDLLHP